MLEEARQQLNFQLLISKHMGSKIPLQDLGVQENKKNSNFNVFGNNNKHSTITYAVIIQSKASNFCKFSCTQMRQSPSIKSLCRIEHIYKSTTDVISTTYVYKNQCNLLVEYRCKIVVDHLIAKYIV